MHKLHQTTIDEGLDHPFVRALVQHLEQRHADMLERLEAVGCDGNASGSYMFTLAGRANEIRLLLSEIIDAKGVQDDER